jgi:hypothetical protein
VARLADDTILTAAELATRWQTSIWALGFLRQRGRIPQWVVLPSGDAAYRISDVLLAEQAGCRGKVVEKRQGLRASEAAGQTRWTMETLTDALETFAGLDPATVADLRRHLFRHVSRLTPPNT